MKNDLAKRIQELEKSAKPPVISTVVDLVKWGAEHEDDDEDVELSPELQELIEVAVCEPSR
jgi:hypothetical protein